MDEQVLAKIKELAQTLPKLPDGRIDYTHAKEAYGVSIVVEHEGKVLFLKRADDLHFYPSLWNVVSGFIDEELPLIDLVYKELKEETGLEQSLITEVKFAEERLVKDSTAVDWHIFPALVRLTSQPEIQINWEHTEYRWVLPQDVTKYDRLPQVEENIRLALALMP